MIRDDSGGVDGQTGDVVVGESGDQI